LSKLSEGGDLALQDAFWLTLVALALAVVAAIFIRVPKPAPQAEEQAAITEQAV
jgi:hypothetical protein